MIRIPGLVAALAAAAVSVPLPALGASFVEVDRLLARDWRPGDASGTAVAVDGDTAVVCAERRSGPLYESGECHLYARDGGAWNFVQLLVPSVPEYGGRFGYSVAVEGDVVVVGASAGCCPGATGAGRAYVFRRSGPTWSEEAMLTPVGGDDDDFFGASVAIRGDVIAVGASGDDDLGPTWGAVHVFRRNGASWPLEQKLASSSGRTSGFFGTDVVFAGVDDLIVGSRFGVFWFARGAQAWQQKQFLDPPTAGFGAGVATNGIHLVVGSPEESATGAGSGALYIHEKRGAKWALVQSLTALDAAGGLGTRVAIRGGTIVAGAHRHQTPAGAEAGAAYVFRDGGAGWAQAQKLTGSGSVAGDRFGRSVALDAETLFVGAPEADQLPWLNVGEAYVFVESVSGQPPTADAGSDATVECTGPEGALVTLDGSGSSDPDSTPGTNDDIVAFEWFEGTTVLGTGEEITVLLALGAHAIGLRVTDADGAADVDEVVKTVVDTAPPALEATLDPSTLWPPNHRLAEVTATLVATGACGASTIVLESIVSDEPDDAPGGADGNTVDDIQDAGIGTDDRTFRLRAERSSQGDGRTYTATYRVTEDSGATAVGVGTAFVPTDQGGVTDPIVLSVAATPSGTRVDWTEVSGLPTYNVVRGLLREIADSGASYSLGEVVCMEAGSTDPSTAGLEDSALPLPGEVFVYVVEYDDGRRVSYGAESAAKPRVVDAGDCP